MEQSCAEITLDTICSLAGINQCACVMFVTLNPHENTALLQAPHECSASKQGPEKTNVNHERQGKKIRGIKKSELIRALETGIPWHTLDSSGLSALLETGQQEMGGLLPPSRAFIHLLSPQTTQEQRTLPRARRKPSPNLSRCWEERYLFSQPGEQTLTLEVRHRLLFPFHSRWRRVGLKEKEKNTLTSGINV